MNSKIVDLIKITLLAILIFFSISFLTILAQINTPFNLNRNSMDLKIGFPYTYYYEFSVNSTEPNTSWNVGNLLLDGSLVWGIIFIFYWILKPKTVKENHNLLDRF